MSCEAGDHCVTCADEGVPMRVCEVADEGLARCASAAAPGGAIEVLTALVGPVAPGDELLVHAGVALVRLG